MNGECNVIAHLHTEIRGHGPPVFLIHGFGTSSFTWSKIGSALATDHTVVMVDLKGFGQSETPRDGHYSLRDHASAVLAVIDALELNGVSVVGHSMGGGVALLVAMALERERPARLSRLVLIDGIACPQPLPLFIKLLRSPIIGPLIMRLVPPTWAVRSILRLAYFDRRKIEPSFVEEYAAPLRSTNGRAALIATARAIIPPDIEELIAQYRTIRAPTLLLWGRQDRIVPLSFASRLEQAMPAAHWRILDDCGHIPQEELPHLALPILREFLEGARR
jgi:pimeloyl-ACP methyl ester carboxylesterase